MYCRNCGSEVTAGYYCSNCGTYAGENVPMAVAAEPLSDSQRIKRSLSSKLFLVIAILVSAQVIVKVVYYVTALLRFEIMQMEHAAAILIVIFAVFTAGMILSIAEVIGFWKAYKGNTNGSIVEASGLKLLTKVWRIRYIGGWSVVGLLAGVGFCCEILIVCGAAEKYRHFEYGYIHWFLLCIILILIAGLCMIFLLIFERKAVKFMKALAVSAETGVLNIEKIKMLRIRLFVLGAIYAVIGACGGALMIIPAAVQICISFWIKRNYTET